MCAVLEGRVGALNTVDDTGRIVVMLPRYVRGWGHVVVLPRAHVTAAEPVVFERGYAISSYTAFDQ